jgi:hypothetical protein
LDLCKLADVRKTKASADPQEKIGIGGRHEALTSFAGGLRNKGMDALEILQHLEIMNNNRLAEPVPMDDLKHIADSVCRYEVPPPEPKLVFGKPTEATVAVEEFEDADIPERMARPRYPDEAWNGTAYGEFGALCTQENAIPKKFFIEALRTAVGAIVGNLLKSSLDGVNPRAYTIFIAPPQKGKGTSISWVQGLFSEFWESVSRSEPPLLFTDDKSIWKSKGIGARIVNPASAPGMMMALVQPPAKKGETGDPTFLWKPIPRVFTMMEEIRGLFANFTLESTGAGLEGVLCELFDRTSFSATATAKRPAVSGEAMLSMLGAITAEEWEKIFSQTSSAGSGFLSRLNIIGSDGDFPRTAGMEIPDFTAFRSSLLARIVALTSRPMTLKPTPAAKQLMGEWFQGVHPSIAARINIHAWRTALHIAWLRDSATFINEHDVQKGIDIAEYQLAMRDYYAAGEGESRAARCEAAIRKALKRGPCNVSELKRLTSYTRYGIGFWNRCLSELAKGHEIRLDGKRVIPLKTED